MTGDIHIGTTDADVDTLSTPGMTRSVHGGNADADTLSAQA